MAHSKVFDTSNSVTLGASWNVQDMSAKKTTKSTSGMCAAMVSKWIQQTMRQGDLTSAGQLGSMQDLAIAHRAYRRGYSQTEAGDKETNLFSTFGLKGRTVTSGTLAIKTRFLFEILALTGFLYCSFKRPGGGHALGFKIGTMANFFFDPNSGLYKFDSQNDLIQVMSDSMVTTYLNKYTSYILREITAE